MQSALLNGDKKTGVSIIRMVKKMDAGPIILQASVDVRDDDTPDTLGARVLEQEHKIYPQALALAASGATIIDGQRVRIKT